MINFLHNLGFYQNIIRGIEFTSDYGVFPMYINPIANNNFGSFSPIVNPHLFLYIPALLNKYFNDISISLNVFFILLNILQFICMFVCIRKLSKKTFQSIFASLLYVAAFILSLNYLFKCGLSESIAVIFIPLVIYGFYDIYFEEGKYKFVLLLSMFLISQANVAIFIITMIFLILFGIIFIFRSLFKLKIFTIIFVIFFSIVLSLYNYVPMVHYYMLKQFSIVDAIGNLNVIIVTFIYCLVPFIYVFVSKKIISGLNNDVVKGFLNAIILIVFTLSVVVYILFYNGDKLKITDDIIYEDTFVPKVDENYFTKNKEYLDNLYKNCGNIFDIFIYNYNRSYLFMNIVYDVNPKCEKVYIDIPYYYLPGFVAYDNNNNKVPIIFGNNYECRVIVSNKTNMVKIGFKPYMIWQVAKYVSILGVVILLLLRIRFEFKNYKKIVKVEEEKIDGNDAGKVDENIV